MNELTVTEPGTITTVAPDPKSEIAYASEIASELNKIIDSQKLFTYISNKKYVAVEGWTTLAALRGCTAREVSNELAPDRDGVYIATVELVNAQGRVIGRASAECGDPDEVDRTGKPVWASRPSYARRSMANTRATSKVCRQVFSWIMVLAGYAATPAEEMPKNEGEATPAQQNATTEPPRAQDKASSPPAAPGGDWDSTEVVFFGKYSKEPEGPIPWAKVPHKYLEWVTENMKDPAKGMATLEIARRAKLEVEVIDVQGRLDDVDPQPKEEEGNPDSWRGDRL